MPSFGQSGQKTKAAVGRVVLTSSLWNFVGRYTSGAMQILILVILTRLLKPADFGIAGLVLATGLFVTQLSEGGIGTAVIQWRGLSQEAISSVYWFSLLLAGALAVLFFLIAPFLGSFFSTPEVVDAVRILSIAFLLVGALAVPHSLLRRDFRFRQIAVIEILGAGLGGLVAVGMALRGFGYWSLIANQIVINAVRLSLSFLFSRWRPLFIFRLAEIRKVLGYSLNIFWFTSISYWSRNVDKLLIGRFLGSVSLGYYDLAYKLTLFPVSGFCGIINQVMHPALASIQDDPLRMRRGFFRATELSAFFCFPLSAILWVAAAPLVRVLWGPGWEPSVNVFQVLAPLVAIQPLVSITGNVFMAQNRTGSLLRVGALNTAILIGGMVIGVYWGIVGVAWGYVLSTLLFVLPITMHVVLGKLLQSNWGAYAQAVVKPLLCGLTVLVVTLSVRELSSGALSPLGTLALLAATGVTGFVAFLRLVAWNRVAELREMLPVGRLIVRKAEIP